jgi:hypothetical protein
MMFNTGAKDLAAETPLPTLYFASKNFSIHVMCMHSVSRITEHGRYLSSINWGVSISHTRETSIKCQGSKRHMITDKHKETIVRKQKLIWIFPLFLASGKLKHMIQ